MQSLHKLFYFAGLLLATGLFSCSKDSIDPTPPVDIVYSTNVDGYTVTFDNQTAGGDAFEWDFGDGTSSTEKSPVHEYPGKGKYVPTLYVTVNGKKYEGSTVLRISKSSAVKLNDNTFSDWDTVSVNVMNLGTGAGIFKQAKFDYDGNYIYFYFQTQSAKTNGDIYDFYMDTDNDPSTGLVTWLFGNGGYDVLLEGAILDGWFDPFYHKGAQNAFSFDYQTISDFYQIGHIEESNGLLTFEGRLSRTKIKGLTGKGLRIGVSITKNDWSAIVGTAPDMTTNAFVLDMSE